MEISSIKVRQCLENLKILKNEDSTINEFLSEQNYDEKKIKRIFNYLSTKILDFEYTECIRLSFTEFMLLIVSCACKVNDKDYENDEKFMIYRRKSYVLSQLSRYSPDILRYAVEYFKNKPPPFQENSKQEVPKKKIKISETSEINDLIIVKTCHNLLTCDPVFFKSLWDWSSFIENYYLKGCDLQKIYCNHIVAFLMHMTVSQLNELNKCISEDIKIQFDNEINENSHFDKFVYKNNAYNYDEKNDKKIYLDFHNDIFVSIEDVLLPLYNDRNAKFYKETDGNYDRIVKVESTKTNLRSIALGILSGKAVCLSGPVGCGKTTLIEYLARKTGRICPKRNEIERYKYESTVKHSVREQNHIKEMTKGNKRKSQLNNSKLDEISEKCNGKIEENNDSLSNGKNGFLRIQLGDQTDSKMILGQYRCTDVPGEFIWLPGVLTQAVMNGYWLLLEDLDCATQETCMILSNLLENKFLSVPGFRDHIKVEPGFQLFFTIRTNQSSNNSQKAGYSLLEKYLYTINIHQLSKSELCEIISLNYPKLSTIANRIVDVFLTFSTNNIYSKYNENNDDMKNSKRDYVSLPHENISIINLPNSGRMVSTRDLMKLCERSNPMFSVTSTECAYFVFQNAVDVFCSYIPQGKEKLKLITSIGAKLGIIQSRCEFYSNEYKPDIKMNDNDNDYDDNNKIVKLGRVTLNVRARNSDVEEDENTFHTSKRIRLSDSKEKYSARKLKNNSSNIFSFTRISSCLLERIAVSIAQNEPILLVGETGVGKTSAVQYTAEKTNHKLIVVNMNNQSDISDLIGGFKPVDLCYIMAPIRSEFEYLFRKTFNEVKNEKFLSNVSICYNQGNFSVLIKLMLRIADTVFKNNENKILKLDSKVKSECYERWTSLNIKLLKLNAQLKKSINISFAFIPGSLVNCIRNGDWVLLDEINLASAETLECLSTILEPDGSIVLLERGDLTPIKRHPDFRIFACMNPSTDIGKKDLPTGIRNRFTEFFVDELITESDLILLVNDYLSNTGIKRAKVLNVVKLYKKLKALSALELNDGLGNRPVFSLRTLCRALRICAKNMCGSIERNLYESFCLSFLTQLDQNSHKIVLELIKNALLTDAKAILSQPIPRPGDNFINFEGYWIQKGPKEIQNCDYYILTESVKQNLKDLCRIISIGKLPVLLQGPTSAGKTSLIEYVAKSSGNYCLRINNHEHTDLQEYIGTYTSDASGKLSFKEGVLVQAMRNGFWIILDELNLASTDILEALNRVLDDNRELFIPEIQTLVKAHPNFMLFATQNPPGLYGGRKTLSRAFKNRFIELHFNDIPKNELEIILEKRCLIPKSYAKKMVNCMSDLQMNRKTTTKNNFTLRDLFRWGNRYTLADKNLLENNSYDWNQHLVDEGYLVLSAKVRTEIELEIIEETLYKNFRKHITTETLFGLNENTSMVTKNILESIHNYRFRSDIIWTQNMTRMAVLTAKALEFNEPALLVGPTGCGKTTICQILANINSKNLRILNCHMHTEGADFLGGLRPCRKNEINDENNEMKTKLFEWVDGPLVLCMKEGNYFMADEISLAEDSVLERLNSVLEPEKTVLLAEKSDISSNNIDVDTLSKLTNEFVIKAKNGFQFLATMNPGGDFGKKELSPALRNRFTEIWCKPSDTSEDLIRIAENFLKIGLKNNQTEEQFHKIATILIDIIFYIKDNIEKFKYSVRDILSWADYISITMNNYRINLPELIILGLETLFLDSLEMIPNETIENVEKLRQKITNFAISKIKVILKSDLTINEIENKREIFLQNYPTIHTALNDTTNNSSDFFFNTPTTKKNLFRLISAMNLNKAILLEGPPGVGKTSIIENLCKIIGYKIVRINLCEHTDLADLFGTDLPAEEKVLEIASINDNKNESGKNSDSKINLGKFVWRDGPLLSALKSNNTWILLDELNLAPQNVLEGLNAILDHRGEVYIPELNKKFLLNKNVRIFGCQNPLKQGGGRKGLPQSFLNRFIKVYLKKLKTKDLLFVIQGKYSNFFQKVQNYFMKYFKYMTHTSLDSMNLFNFINEKNNLKEIENNETNSVQLDFDLAERMVKFSELLDKGITNLEFGYKGGPFETNLRDLLRWCSLLIDSNTGFIINEKSLNKSELNCLIASIEKSYKEFLQILYERMKLVYYQRMRSENDKIFIRNAFSEVFNCDAEKLNEISEDISLYWTDKKLYLNDISIDRELILKDFEKINEFPIKKNSSPLMLLSQREILKNMIECLYMEIPIILCGPTDSGKTKIVDILCTIINQIYETDTIDDSITGGFQQIDLNRHLEESSNAIESVLIIIVQKLIIKYNRRRAKEFGDVINLFSLWKNYSDLKKTTYDSQNLTAMSDELILFKKRINSLCIIIEKLLSINECEPYKTYLSNIQIFIINLKMIVKNSETLNTGGHFEWYNSKFVKCLKYGKYICLEHVNLCSSAIVDRLNSVFEPNGYLLISEKGIIQQYNNHNNEKKIEESAEIIYKHKNFRAFLTIDPKNGELSRAMRNRCIEISLTNDNYTKDDLKFIIYENGIHEWNLINIILRIHEDIRKLSDFSPFTLSNLIHFSSLVASYKRIGFNNYNAIYNSAIEVYVNSSYTDLLGYGLEFYHTKLKKIIQETIELNLKITNKKNLNEYNVMKNITIKSGNLDTIAMIKLQTEPLCITLRNFTDNELIKQQFTDLYSNFQNINFEVDLKLIRFLIYMLYELSTLEDITLRNKYLNEYITKIPSQKEIVKELLFLSNLYMKLIKTEENNLLSSYDKCLPWNRKLFKRIRDYSSRNDVNNEEDIELNLSAILISHLLIDNIPVYKIEKLQKITAIGYSQAVISNLISDNLNNEFIKQISIFLENVHSVLINSLKSTKFIKIANYVDFIVKLLWINRFYELSKTKILIDKKINKNLLDKLILHYKWIEKYFLELLMMNKIDTINEKFRNSLTIMKNYIINNTQPLNVLKKIYFKKFINFLPLYTSEQIKLYELKDKFDKLFSIIPTYGNLSKVILLKKINFVLSENSQIIKEKFLKMLENENLCYIQNICNLPIDFKSNITTNEELKSIINDIQIEAANNENSMIVTVRNFSEIESSLQEFENSLNTKIDDEGSLDVNGNSQIRKNIPNEIAMNIIPFLEYYVVKSLIAIHDDSINKSNTRLNTIYFEDIHTLNCTTMEIIKMINSKKYKNFQKLWNYIIENIESSNCGQNKFEDLLNNLSITYYKNLSTFNRLIYSSLQKYRLRNLSLRSDLYIEIMDQQKNEFNADIDYNGSPLINSLTSLLFQYNGQLREIALNDLNLWRMTVKRVQDIIWNNSHIVSEQFLNGKFDLKSSIILSSKLLLEVQYIEKMNKSSGDAYFETYQDGFKKLTEKLNIENHKAIDILSNIKEKKTDLSVNMNNWKITYSSSILHTLIGSIELCLLSYSPIVDPVEKNHLKNNYINEDIEYLNKFKTVYDLMKCVMNYKNFGYEIASEVSEKIKTLEKRKNKFQQKVALRPSEVERNSFNNLMQEIQHFCNTNCDPNTLLMLVENSEKYSKYVLNETEKQIFNSYEMENILIKMNDMIRKINLWISNSQKFLNFTLQKYKIYYNDFVKPIDCAITMLQYGFEGLKKSLIQLKNSYYSLENGDFKSFHENNKLCSIIKNIGQFPNVYELNLFSDISQKDVLKNKSNIFTVLNRIEGCESLYIQLLKAKLIEIKNHLKLSNELNLKIFNEFNLVLNICNKIWQDEEDNRKKRIAEEESLYTHKTRCETQNEDEIELNEIQNNFPTFVQKDFGEFIIEDTLEKVVKLSNNDSKQNSKNINHLIKDEDYKFFGENFIHIMENFSSCYYYQPKMKKLLQNNLELVEVFKLKTNAFIKLFNQYKFCLNEDCLDEAMYNTFILAVGLHKQTLTNDCTLGKNSQSYNFYKDANVKEVISIADILNNLENRVLKQLELYPDHAVLNDIIIIIKRIRNFSFTSPIARFNIGFQLLRQKVSQWNDVAHKLNHLKDIETEIAGYVQRWTRLELQFWRNCLSQSYQKVEANAYKYWFFIYNLLHEFIYENEIDSSYTDFKVTEKKFEDENFYESNENNSNNKCHIRIEDIIKILRQFIEASNYADFNIRMKLLKSFELYLHNIDLDNNSPKETLISVLYNLRIYFEQFSQEIEEMNRFIKTPIEKKLRDFIKIESYNKDLSYFSMRNNVAKIHRNLNKFLKEYESLLREKITKIFQQKDNMNSEYAILNNDKGINLRHESKVKYYMIDSTNFIISQKYKKEDEQSKNINFDNKLQLSLLSRISKLFSTSKNIVKRIISKTNYSNMICSLDSILIEQFETCDYLRKLEIDRTQTKTKQISQAKQILSLKRKALSDLFKILSNLGINFKSGLMESTLKMNETTTTNDFVNYEITPFDIRTMFIESKFKKKFYKNMQNLNENLNTYFAKCIFKLKLLQNVMLTPQSELGLPNIERIKGYAIDMYILVQNQRIILSKSTKELHDLRNLLVDINSLQLYAKNCNFEENILNFSTVDSKLYGFKRRFSKIRYVLEQFNLLLENVPEEHNSENNCVFMKMNYEMEFSNTNEKISVVIEELGNILNSVHKALTELMKLNNETFFDLNKISDFVQIEFDIIKKIEKLRKEFAHKNEKYNLSIVKPLTELLEYLKNDTKKIHSQEKSNEIDFENYENIDVELENIIHSILLSLQKLYKKYMNEISSQVTIEYDKDTLKYNKKFLIKDQRKEQENEKEGSDKDDNYEIFEKHLKEKITAELEADLKILNFTNIHQKLRNIVLTIKYGKKLNGKMSYVKKLLNVLPLLEQYCLIGDYYVFQQLGAHKISAKMLSIMLTVFIELGSKGFCIPPDLMQSDEEEGEEKNKNEQKNDGGFGLEDGTGENNASDKIESEDQLEDAKRPEDRQNDEKKSEENCKEENGIEMSEDFDGKMQDIEKPDDEENSSKEDENEEEDLDKEMGETEEGAEKLDDQIWGSDEENEQSEDENDMNEEEGKGSKEEDDQHNDLSTKNDIKQGENDKNEGLDATDDDKERRKQKNDIDNMQQPELDEEQVNPYHNELEEPPEPEDMDLSNNFNIDEEDQRDKDDENCDENPFDIDNMKENMNVAEEEEEKVNIQEDRDLDNNQNENNENETSDSESEPEAGTKSRETDNDESVTKEDEEKNEEKTDDAKLNGNVDDLETNENEKEFEENKVDDEKEYNESKNNPTKDNKAQSIPQDEQKGSLDQIQTDDKMNIEQDENMDEQDTGEEKNGIGQAENDKSEKGHKGIAETKQTETDKSAQENENIKEKRKQGRTEEQRTLGEAEKNQVKQLKTVDKLKEQKSEEECGDVNEMEADVYQHVREPKKTDKLTLDNATEEQSKQIKHLDDKEKNEEEKEECNENEDQLESDDEINLADEVEKEVNNIASEKTEQKSEKSSNSEKTNEKCETTEQMEVEGDVIESLTVPRGDDTSAHCIKEILTDQNVSTKPSALEILELRKIYQTQILQQKSILPHSEDHDIWYLISNKMLPNARELCEQLRLILEPTKCTRLKGDYRTGRRINMKKIIPYIASQFRKDKIWLRRTKPAQRDYKITIAIDDSKSMHHNNSKMLTLEAISLVSQALTLLESGKLSIVSFGESPQIILNHTEQFDGPKLVKSLNFSQNQSRIAELLDFVRTMNTEEDSSSSNGLFENLLLILSDGRNIYSEGEQKVKNSVKLARLQRIFLIYIIIDNPENKHSILDIRIPQFSSDKKSITMRSYLDVFPFPYYVIVRDLGQLPLVLSDAMRQWFELVNSEQ